MNVTPRRPTGDSCPRFREAISARLDGEDPGMADDVIDAHLARCPDCARFAQVAAWEHRRLRVRSATPVPDLTAGILARLAAEPAPPAIGAAVPAAGPTRIDGGRRRRWAVAAAACVALAGVGFAGGGVLAAHAGSNPSGGSSSGGAPGGGAALTNSRYPGATLMSTGVPKPGVELTDTSGHPYDLARATAGKVTLVYFGYTHCPDLCPINMALTAAALRHLPAAERRRIDVVFITTDPARDTPEVLRAWLDRFSSSFVGLTGSLAAIHHAEEQVQMPLSYAETVAAPTTGAPAGHQPTGATTVAQDYQVVHAGYTLVYSEDGRANLTVDDSALPTQFATTLQHLVSYGYQEPR